MDELYYEYEDRDPPSRKAREPRAADKPRATGGWREAVSLLASSRRDALPFAQPEPALKAGRLWYLIDTAALKHSGRVSIEFYQQERNAKGTWGKIKEARLSIDELDRFDDAKDRAALELLLGCTPKGEFAAYSAHYQPRERQKRVEIEARVQSGVLARLAATGRLIYDDGVMPGDDDAKGMRWDEGAAFDVKFVVMRAEAPRAAERGDWMITARFERPGESLGVNAPQHVVASGLLLLKDRMARLRPMSMPESQWVGLIRKDGPMSLPAKEVDSFAKALAEAGSLPGLELPDDFPWRWDLGKPTPRLSITASAGSQTLSAQLGFDYGKDFDRVTRGSAAIDAKAKTLVTRDLGAEDAAHARLSDMASPGANEGHYWIARHSLGALVETLSEEGWLILAEAGRVKRASEPKLKVEGGGSGVDWFDLSVKVDYGGKQVPMPELLDALQRGESFVRLGDGTFGLLPDEWLKRFGAFSRVGSAAGTPGGWRFSGAQILLLEALLKNEPAADVDHSFAHLRTKLAHFAGVKPAQPAGSFKGTLRPYQAEGLGWLQFLAEFDLGGCLADDMGLGKTIQVLALLEGRRVQRVGRPSLVVVPKSLVSNWVEEAAKFAPELKVAVYGGNDRKQTLARLASVDVIVVTYNVMRRDVAKLSTVDFDYAILDEAQHIKNEDAQVAKAARMLRARHRLAMSGTPVENHLRELGSLFEFLNPGMLGDALTPLRSNSGDVERETVAAIGAALKPLILRRTKEQVLTDLPAKTEQTLYCDFEPTEQTAYDELRRHYHQSLTTKIDQDGIGKAKIHVLEALLRLRQASCHPGLIDASKVDAPSAKVDLLLDQLREVAGSGHKALVFSQFTSLLGIVRTRLQAEGLAYEYLDGQTQDRQARVARFQTDASCPIFLISLKAGGVGLNLTAADYCYILDPWWNPAAEAQAIDRAHRIGQTRRVFAYRLITRGTVEEKILILQAKKKNLADTIIQADESFLTAMTAEDLESLLMI